MYLKERKIMYLKEVQSRFLKETMHFEDMPTGTLRA